MLRPKVWLLAQYWATADTLEVATSALHEAEALGIEVDDGLSPEEPPKYADGLLKVLAYFEPKPGLEKEIREKLELFFASCEMQMGELSFSLMPEDDWQGNFVRSCTTFMVEPTIYVVPSFEIEEFKKDPKGDLFIEMDPENAFGTGQHQTTKLCLKNIAKKLLSIPEANRAKMRGLDVGTGTGILAILMKKMGVGQVFATENDLDALDTAQRNIIKNEVLVKLIAVDEEYQYPKTSFDIIVANILAPVLWDMAEEFLKACELGGHIILSGILDKEAPKLITKYEQLGAIFIEQENMDDWCMLIFAKPDPRGAYDGICGAQRR